MARIRLSALSPAASGVVGFSLGAAAILLLPGNLANALGLLSAGLGLAGAAALSRRNAAREREQLLAAIGEVKVRLATNAIRVDSMAKRLDQMPMGEADAAPAKAMLHELTAEVGLLGDLSTLALPADPADLGIERPRLVQLLNIEMTFHVEAV